jgi:large subunit ribosomal protein L13
MNKIQSTKAKDIRREWHLIDVKGKVLGRIATEIAQLLIGKSKPYFVPNLDCGDYVVVVNAKLVTVTGKKGDKKLYSRYSGYPGGLKQKSFNQIINHDPRYIINETVSGMLPQNKLRDSMMKRLYVFSETDHTYKNKFSK